MVDRDEPAFDMEALATPDDAIRVRWALEGILAVSSSKVGSSRSTLLAKVYVPDAVYDHFQRLETTDEVVFAAVAGALSTQAALPGDRKVYMTFSQLELTNQQLTRITSVWFVLSYGQDTFAKHVSHTAIPSLEKGQLILADMGEYLDTYRTSVSELPPPRRPSRSSRITTVGEVAAIEYMCEAFKRAD